MFLALNCFNSVLFASEETKFSGLLSNTKEVSNGVQVCEDLQQAINGQKGLCDVGPLVLF